MVSKSEISASILDGTWEKEDRQLLKKNRAMSLCDTPLGMLYIKTEKKGRKEKKTRPAATPYSRLPPASYNLGKVDEYGVLSEYI